MKETCDCGKWVVTGLAWAAAGVLAGCSQGEVDANQAAAANYPLQVCVVAGEKLGAHGAPYVFRSGDEEVRLCCDGCLEDFQAKPEVYLKIIKKAREANRAGA